MPLMKLLLIISIVATIAYMIYIVTEPDSIENLIDIYLSKPLTDKRIVVVLRCDGELCEDTIKSLLKQNIRINDIAVETTKPDLINERLKKIVSIHKPDTTSLRETEADTIVLFLTDGHVYDHDYIERRIK